MAILLHRLIHAGPGRRALLAVLPAILLVGGTAWAGGQRAEFQNSLGMVFHRIEGTHVRFSVWETRLADWNAYLAGVGRSWSHRPSFAQSANDPVVSVTIADAAAFCDWLTKKEQAMGLLRGSQAYRLPTNNEWDRAVGVESTEVSSGADRTAAFPWGSDWPPPADAGNYNRARMVGAPDDSHPFTAPVGSFRPGPGGLWDLGGNVWEWTCDLAPDHAATATLRGGSWLYWSPEFLGSSRRLVVEADLRAPSIGFRCVLEDAAEAREAQERNARVDRSRREQLLHREPVSDDELRRVMLERNAPGVAATGARAAVPSPAEPGRPFLNSLNLRLLPLSGMGILLGEHELRVMDYRLFQLAVGAPLGSAERHRAGSEHPVTGVSWEEAVAFCAWLTRREQDRGLLPKGAAYRLPRSGEWRAAVSPATDAHAVYAWGATWPPPSGFAHVEAGSSSAATGRARGTKPVKSFPGNALGFHDLVGNAAEWCEDACEGRADQMEVCGGSWNSSHSGELRIDAVEGAPRSARVPEIGFRLALDFGAGAGAVR